jgi:hypothetical protein
MMRFVRSSPALLLSLVIACAGSRSNGGARTDGAATPAASSTIGVARVQSDAVKMEPFVKSDLAHEFVRATKDLPHVEPRTIYREKGTRHWFKDDKTGGTLEAVRIDEEAYYNTPQYGAILAYARPFDLLADAWRTSNGRKSLAGLKVLDFGYGAIGHLWSLAHLGAETVGVEVDPMLPILYADVRDPKIVLVDGRYPADPGAKAKVGAGYDLFISKNTLKKGYVHPDQPTDPRMRIDLGMSDAEFLATLNAALKPGGWVMIYNICPAPAPPGKPFIPWSDGRSPFARADLEKAGFEVVAFDQDDTAAARIMGKILGWDVGDEKIDLEHDTFAMYTLFRKTPAK